MKVSYKKAKEVMLEADKILILVAGRTTYCDGDALGSSLALALILRKRYCKNVKINTAFNIIRKLEFLPNLNRCKFADPTKIDFSLYDLIIVCDASQPTLIVDQSKYKDFSFPKEARTLSIDHHVSNSCWATYTLLDEKSSSTGETIANLFKQDLDKDSAVNCLVGILWDTAHFRYRTNANTLAVVVRLLKRGADISEVSSELNYPRESMNTLNLIKKGINRIAWSKKGGYTYTHIAYSDVENLDQKEDYGSTVSSIINYYSRCIEEARFGVTFFEEQKGMVQVEIRGNKDPNIDLSKIASIFGGGGHYHAAGFAIQGNIRDIIKEVVSEIDDYLRKNDYFRKNKRTSNRK